MALMHERIGDLAKKADERLPEAWPFCHQVCQVRFNAWHYVDTNLWASLAATMFDTLAHEETADAAEIKARPLPPLGTSRFTLLLSPSRLHPGLSITFDPVSERKGAARRTGLAGANDIKLSWELA